MSRSKKSEFLKAVCKMWEIMPVIVSAILEMGGSNEDLLRLLTDKGLVKKVAELIMAGKKQVWDNCKVIVDYTMSLSAMIDAGKYYHVEHKDQLVKHFASQISGNGKQEANLVLVTVGEILNWLIAQGQNIADQEQIEEEWVTTKQVFAYLASHGLLPASIEHLLALGATRPKLQERFLIVALGSVWECAAYNYLSLWCCNGRCDLLLHDINSEYRWRGNADLYLLAVGK